MERAHRFASHILKFVKRLNLSAIIAALTASLSNRCDLLACVYIRIDSPQVVRVHDNEPQTTLHHGTQEQKTEKGLVRRPVRIEKKQRDLEESACFHDDEEERDRGNSAYHFRGFPATYGVGKCAGTYVRTRSSDCLEQSKGDSRLRKDGSILRKGGMYILCSFPRCLEKRGLSPE